MASKKDRSMNSAGLTAVVSEQRITDTLEKNYMPYAMSVIVSRAIPEIDGFKPSHRKLLYTMYKMGLLTGARTKSANVVGQTMRLNPHGESAIYETMVRLSRGYEALLCPFVDSKGNFGKVYSRDMAYAASRYTEVKLDAVCSELFSDIDRDTVDFFDNYDGTMKEPALLPSAFPNVLVSANQGIAVGMASQICGFNLAEVCKTTVKFIKNPSLDIISTLPAPDFRTGGEIVYDEGAMRDIYTSGRGSFKVRSRWRYDKKENLIEIFEIPYTTTVEAIMDKISELAKQGKLRDIADMRDETDLSGLKLTMNLRRGVDPDRLMQRLFKQTPLMDAFSCNFNILIGGSPRVMGIREILEEWCAWRYECVRRRVFFDLGRKKERFHLLAGLSKILLDIDRAIAIIRGTEEESEVIPNLMIGFLIDETQADYIAEIKLRNINRQYILKRLSEKDELERTIRELGDLLKNRAGIMDIITGELTEIAKKYGAPRKTGLVFEHEVERYNEEDHIEDYPVSVFLSREGYLKKITAASLRMSGEQKYKENDGPFLSFDGTNKSEIIVFTNKCQAYKARLFEFDDHKASLLGDFLPSKLSMDEGENPVFMFLPGDYKGTLLFFFENGKVARVSASGYDTKSNRKKLTGAYSDKSPLSGALHISEDCEVALYSTDGRVLIFNTAQLSPKTTRSTQGVGVMMLKPRHKLDRAIKLAETGITNASRYRARSLPAAGALLRGEDVGEVQMSID